MSRKSLARRMAVLAALLLFLAPAQAKKKPIQTFIRPGLTAEIPDAANTFATSPRGCANDVWAAAISTIVERQNVKLPAKDWSVRLAGGDACLQTLPELDSLRKSVEGDYPLGNGRRVRIRLRAAAGAPRAADPLATELVAGRPLIVIHKGQPLLLYGMTYDEHIINNLRKELWITELRLVNPAARPGSEARTVTIKREDGKADEIEMLIAVDVEPIGLGQLESH